MTYCFFRVRFLRKCFGDSRQHITFFPVRRSTTSTVVRASTTSEDELFSAKLLSTRNLQIFRIRQFATRAKQTGDDKFGRMPALHAINHGGVMSGIHEDVIKNIYPSVWPNLYRSNLVLQKMKNMAIRENETTSQ